MTMEVSRLSGAADASADITTPLILDFLEWLAPEPRPYAEVMEVWRTSCPRLTVWEDAVDGGYVVRRRINQQQALVEMTPRGRQRLAESGRAFQAARASLHAGDPGGEGGQGRSAVGAVDRLQ